MRLRQGMDSKGRIRGYSMSWWGAVLGTKRWKLVCDDMRRQPTPGVLSAVGNARRGNGSPFEFEFVSFEVGVDMDHDSINLRRVWADQKVFWGLSGGRVFACSTHAGMGSHPGSDDVLVVF